MRNRLLFGFAIALLIGASRGVIADEKRPESEAVWAELSQIDPDTGKTTPAIQKIISKPLKISGFLVANEFNAGDLTEFLLARYPTGCIHVPLPPPNNMIHVRMAEGKSSKPFFGKRVIVTGRLSIGGRVDSAFEMTADSVDEFTYHE